MENDLKLQFIRERENREIVARYDACMQTALSQWIANSFSGDFTQFFRDRLEQEGLIQ